MTLHDKRQTSIEGQLEKGNKNPTIKYVYPEKDVREAVKKLKEQLTKGLCTSDFFEDNIDIAHIINFELKEIFGEGLIK